MIHQTTPTDQNGILMTLLQIGLFPEGVVKQLTTLGGLPPECLATTLLQQHVIYQHLIMMLMITAVTVLLIIITTLGFTVHAGQVIISQVEVIMMPLTGMDQVGVTNMPMGQFI